MIVDLADLKAQLRVDHDDDNVLIEQKIAAAQAHVENAIGFPIEETYAAPLVVPEPLKEAVRLYAAHLYENREASIVGVTIIPVPGFQDIINSYRDWTF
ncbi:MAG TPA: phage gp6-like head-tail connector protein [Aurantimonas coralicida]|uniref:Phage gp6-like head-tail connector protein n=2 Tax=root TaxID=1 RepID=A0A9C9TIS7_9HYPH|nr:phage gp6-like head-tail connector protein [Aurantimonas coralicida]HEU02614.1 phage gp6-like head-tail connector protein [Aurantimonas coralicida]